MYIDRVFTLSDRFRLGKLLDSCSARSMAARRVLDELEFQLEESAVVESELIADNIVTMNSTVRLIRVGADGERYCTLVYPEDVDLVDGGVSVLSTFGSRLIGCEVGDLLECQETDGNVQWQVAEIVAQPEQAGAFHL